MKAGSINLSRWLWSIFLDFRFELHVHVLDAAASRELDESTALSVLNTEYQAQHEQERRFKLSAYLRSVLRNHPYWATGHLELAQLALSERDIPSAYASSLAVLALKSTGPSFVRAKHLLGCCHLQSGAGEKAKQLLEEAKKLDADNAGITEDLAAACIALGDKHTARELLGAIPDDRISQEGKTALAYLRRT